MEFYLHETKKYHVINKMTLHVPDYLNSEIQASPQ